jgi:hypothetical protein
VKVLAAILGVALVAVGGVAIHMWQQVALDRQQIADLQSQLQQAQTAQQNAEAALARQARELANRPESTIALAAPAPAPAASKATVSATSTALADEMRKQMTDPKGRDVRRAQRRMLLPQLNPGLGKWLDLPPDQENKLLDLMAKQESEQSEMLLDPANRNDPAAQQEAMRKAQAQNQANEADLAALLGDRYPRYQQYKQTMPVHRQVSQLQTMLGSGADGLPDAQAKSLTNTLVAEQLRVNQERASAQAAAPTLNVQEMLRQQQQRTVESNRRLLQVATSLLNPQQLASYRTLIEQQERSTDVLSRQLGAAEAAAAAARQASDQ